jgi:hypothetical protein
LQVRQPKRPDSVAAESGAKECKKRGVLRNLEDLPVAQGPACGREAEGDGHDLADKWF